MIKRLISLLLAGTTALSLLLTGTVTAYADDDGYNDTTIDWGEHTTHIYDWCDDYSCNVCGALRYTDHVYDHNCDADCNYCGDIRTVPDHEYLYFCDDTCEICGYVRVVQHVYANCADKVCYYCGYERESAGHVYDDTWDAECNMCGERRGVVTILTQPVSVEVMAEGDEASATVIATGDNLTYAWYWAPKGSNTFYKSGSFTGDTYSVEMTPERDGRKIYCVVSDDYGNSLQTDTVTLSIHAHTYSNACDTDCNGCGALRQVGDHVYADVCDETCDVCGFVRVVYHDWVDATCTTLKTCTICGVTEGNVLPHAYTSAVTLAPTCTAAGERTYTCPDCGDNYTESIPPLDHDWVDATCTAPKTCTTCGVTEGNVLPHAYTSAVTLTPTCTAAGERTYTCPDCGDNYTESISPLGHAWKDATCTAPKTCTTCGVTEGDVLPHNYTSAVTLAPTCAAAGEWTYTCTGCGDRYTESIAPLGHTWTAGRCTVCGGTSPSKVTIVTEPKTATYGKEGETVTITVAATGDGLTYQWYLRNATGKTYSKSSVVTDTYSVALSSKSHNRRIYCIVTDQYGNQVRTKTVLVRRQATITKEPSAVAYAAKGKKATVKISAVGDQLTYTWYYKNSGASKYSKSSVKTATYSTTMSSTSKGRKVYCVVKDKYGKKVQTKTFLLRQSVSITTQPKTVTVKKNATAKVTVKAAGDGLKYTWYVKDAGKTKYSKSSITKSTYSVKMTSKVKNRLVYCVVTDKYGKTVQTVTVKLKMK